MDAPVSVSEALVALGLGTPSARAFVAGTAATSFCYAASFPSQAFREDGSMRPFAPLTQGPDGVVGKHFLAIPIGVALAVYLFT